jgi:hypothetical protein
MTENMLTNNKKSMKIPKDVIRIVNRNRTYIVIDKRTRTKTKRQTKIYKILHRKLNIEEYNPTTETNSFF